MELVRYSPEHKSDWNAFCRKCDDAWFFHTRDWLDYAAALAANRFVGDASFLIVEGHDIVAVAPGLVIADPENARRHAFRFPDQPAPWPAFSMHAKTARDVLEAFVFSGYTQVARELGLCRIELFGSVLAESFFGARSIPANLPVRYGYTGTVFDTQVINLSQSIDDLWRAVRKGHKSSIKAGRKTFAIDVWCGAVPDLAFRSYQDLHALAAGRVTRPQSTFDAMHRWVREGNAVLVGARTDNGWIGFAYFLMYRSGAMYASACNHPDAPTRMPIGHALVWEAILHCRRRGAKLVEMGMQFYASDESDDDAKKLASIASYKRGFGGFSMPRFQAALALDLLAGTGAR